MSRDDSFRVPDFLAHIVESIDRIHLYVEDMSGTDFLADNKTRDAVVRSFEIIG